MAHSVAPAAEIDLDDIWLYVAKQSSSIEIADRVVESVTDRFSFLSTFPFAGRARDEDYGEGVRSFPSGDYIIL